MTFLLPNPFNSKLRARLMKRASLLLRLHETGFTLMEMTVAMFLIGTVVLGTVSLFGATSRSSASADSDATLLQLVRDQIEAVYESPFQADPDDYLIIPDLPAGDSVSLVATDPGTKYKRPDGTFYEAVIQEIEVKVVGDESELSMTFYKIAR